MRSAPDRTPPRQAGFTLMETLVVIGIIVLIASLVLAVSSTVSRAADERNSRNTLTVLDTAIEEYERSMDRRVTYRSGPAPNGILDDAVPTGLTGRWDVWSAQKNTSAIADEKPPPGSGPVDWGAGFAKPYSTFDTGAPSYSMVPFRRTARLIWSMAQSPSTQSIMQSLPETVYKAVMPAGASVTPTGLRHVIDSWDVPIVAVFPGRDARRQPDGNLAADNVNAIDADGTIKCDSEWGTPSSPTPHQQGGMLVSCKNKRILFVSAGPDNKFHQNATTLSADNLYSYEP